MPYRITTKSGFVFAASFCALLYCGTALAEPSADETAVLNIALKSPPEVKVGIGGYLGINEDGLAQISAVYEGQAAKKAGLREDDIVLEIDGQPTAGMKQEDLDKKLAVPAGVEAKLLVRRAGEKDNLTFSIKRMPINTGIYFHSAKYHQAMLEMLKPLADKGVAEAENSIGVYYEGGLGVTQDYKQAAEWYGKAAAHGAASGDFNLGMLLYEGKGSKPNREEGKKHIAAAAEKGYADAEVWMGHNVEASAKTAADKEEALKWYLRAAGHEDDKASDSALHLMADKELDGKHDAEACLWLRLRQEMYWGAVSGDSPLNYEKMLKTVEQRLGPDGVKTCHQNVEKWVPPSITKAQEAFEKSDNDALKDLSQFYTNRAQMQPAGPEFAQVDYENGVKWQQKIAQLGDPDEQRYMSDFLTNGVSVMITDPAGAHEWLLKAAAQNDPTSEEQLGNEYMNGSAYVDRDEAEAFKWYKKAAESGHNAISALAGIYQKGSITPQDLAEAYKWLAISESQQSHGAGCGVLASPELKLLVARMKPALLAEGRKRTADWLKAYVAKGNREGLQMLGRAYGSDLLGDPNFDEAYFWLKLAAQVKPTYRTATDKKELAEAAFHLSPEALKAADQRIAEYKQPEWIKGQPKNFGGTAQSVVERAQCMSVTTLPCVFDDCAAGGDCKPGWKPAD